MNKVVNGRIVSDVTVNYGTGAISSPVLMLSGSRIMPIRNFYYGQDVVNKLHIDSSAVIGKSASLIVKIMATSTGVNMSASSIVMPRNGEWVIALSTMFDEWLKVRPDVTCREMVSAYLYLINSSKHNGRIT